MTRRGLLGTAVALLAGRKAATAAMRVVPRAAPALVNFGDIKVGDVFTIAGVYDVRRPLDRQKFVVQSVSSGHLSR